MAWKASVRDIAIRGVDGGWIRGHLLIDCKGTMFIFGVISSVANAAFVYMVRNMTFPKLYTAYGLKFAHVNLGARGNGSHNQM